MARLVCEAIRDDGDQWIVLSHAVAGGRSGLAGADARAIVFTWKASKFITHWKRLSKDCKSSLALMETRLKVLGPKLGAVLFQLPARFKADRERLAGFIKLLSKRRRYAFE